MDLHVQQDENFQAREWTFERLGWLLMLLLVVGGLAGLLGPGPLSWATAGSDAGLVQVDYQRVTHHEADDSIVLTFAPEAARNGTITVELTGGWVTGVDRQGITPQPSDESAIPGGTVLEVPVERPGTTRLHITFRAQEYGRLSAEVAVGGDRTSFSQFVLP